MNIICCWFHGFVSFMLMGNGKTFRGATLSNSICLSSEKGASLKAKNLLPCKRKHFAPEREILSF